MKPIKTLVLVIIVVALFLGMASIYTVREGQLGLLLRLGKMERNPKTGKVAVKYPGLHFKLPFAESARVFDARLQTLDMKSSRIVTAEKKDVIVDFYVKWRIKKLPLYFTRTTGNPQQAGILLQQQLNDSLRAEFGKRTIKEVVSDDRSQIMEALSKQANITAANLGVDVVDVRIKRIDLPEQVSAAVFDRMRAERERVATEHRSKGKAKAEAIRAQSDANVIVTLAIANAQAAKLRAEGDGVAARIYSDAYTKDSAFFAFYRSILAYRNAFSGHNDILVLQPDSQFFKYFQTSGSKKHVGRKVKSEKETA